MSNTEVRPADSGTGWFSVRCVFQGANGTPSAYEERITLWQAASFEDAVALAESDARDYAAALGNRYLGLAQAYHLADEIGHGAEVYSLIRDSNLPPDQYLTAYFDTGSEHHGHMGEETAHQPVQQRSTATDRTEPVPE